MQLWSDFNKTVLFVTHDVEEAIYLSDEIHVMGDAARAASSRPSRSRLPRPRIRAQRTVAANSSRIKERCLELLHLEPTAPNPSTKQPKAARQDR